MGVKVHMGGAVWREKDVETDSRVRERSSEAEIWRGGEEKRKRTEESKVGRDEC